MVEGEYLQMCGKIENVTIPILECIVLTFMILTFYVSFWHVCVIATSRWIGAAKFLTGASTVGSLAIPIILRHAHMIDTGAMFIEFVSFFIFVCTVLCFHRVSLEDDW